LTANALDTDRAACLAAGTNEHIGKPFDINHLVSTLIRLTHWSEVPQDVFVPAPSNGTDSMHAMDADGMSALEAFAAMEQSVPAPFDAPLEQLNEAMASMDFASAAVIARDLLSRIQRTTLN
jgi:CheY-like chemotaxis protein